MATVTVDVSVVTVFPPASCTVTTGCVDNADPPVPFPGSVVNASFAAAPTVTLNGLLTTVPADVSTVLPVAVSV